jgi:hypothetical protein
MQKNLIGVRTGGFAPGFGIKPSAIETTQEAPGKIFRPTPEVLVSGAVEFGTHHKFAAESVLSISITTRPATCGLSTWFVHPTVQVLTETMLVVMEEIAV